MPRRERLLPPPAPEQPGWCVHDDDRPAAGWRWYAGLGRWERVCASHYTRNHLHRGDYVPDTARVERQERT